MRVNTCECYSIQNVTFPWTNWWNQPEIWWRSLSLLLRQLPLSLNSHTHLFSPQWSVQVEIEKHFIIGKIINLRWQTKQPSQINSKQCPLPKIYLKTSPDNPMLWFFQTNIRNISIISQPIKRLRSIWSIRNTSWCNKRTNKKSISNISKIKSSW